MTNTTVILTPASARLFALLVEENNMWGTAWFLSPVLTKEQRGNQSDLVQKGLIFTDASEDGNFVQFSEAGVAYATGLGMIVCMDEY